MPEFISRWSDFTFGRELLLSEAVVLYNELKGLHKPVAYLAFCCPKDLTAILYLLNACAALKMVCGN